MAQKFKIRKDDTVEVIAGKDKGKRGSVVRVITKNDTFKAYVKIHYIDTGTLVNHEFEFDTNYLQTRFVCTQVAYTKGWKVKAINESGEETTLKTYNAQGGFVGFVAPTGNVHYVMSYMTPYLKTGAIISITSFFLAAGTTVGLVFLRKKTRKEEVNN